MQYSTKKFGFGGSCPNNQGEYPSEQIRIAFGTELTDEDIALIQADFEKRTQFLIENGSQGFTRISRSLSDSPTDSQDNGFLELAAEQCGEVAVELTQDFQGMELSAEESIRFPRELLSAIRQLHDNDLCFGDLQFEDLVVTGKGMRSLRLANFPMGALSYLSNGAILRNSSQTNTHSYLPESSGKPHDPSKKGDLYLAGLIICQLFGGRKVIEDQSDLDSMTSKIPNRGLKKFVRNRLVGPDPKSRCESGETAIEEFERSIQQSSSAIPIGLCCGLAALAILSFWFYSQSNSWLAKFNDTTSQLDQTNQKLSNRESELQALGKINDDFKNQVEASQKRIQQLELEIGKLTPAAPPQKPKEPVLVSKEVVTSQARKIFNEISESPADSDHQKIIKQSLQQIRDLNFKERVEKQLNDWEVVFEKNRRWELGVWPHSTNQFERTAYVIVAVDGVRAKYQQTPELEFVNFQWRPGQKIKVEIWGNGSFQDDLIYSQEYTGKYALWQLQRNSDLLRNETLSAAFYAKISDWKSRGLLPREKLIKKPINLD